MAHEMSELVDVNNLCDSMEKLGFDLRGTCEAASADKGSNLDQVFAIQRCVNSLVHACKCRDANCQSPGCHKMKRVVSHTRQCERNTSALEDVLFANSL